MEANFSEYMVAVTTEPSYYGSTCTKEDAERIVENLESIISENFPGIRIVRSEMGVGRAQFGPDIETVEDIRLWIEDNWTAAL